MRNSIINKNPFLMQFEKIDNSENQLFEKNFDFNQNLNEKTNSDFNQNFNENMDREDLIKIFKERNIKMDCFFYRFVMDRICEFLLTNLSKEKFVYYYLKDKLKIRKKTLPENDFI